MPTLKLRPQDTEQCDRAGCHNPAGFYVLMRAGAVQVCKTHLQETCYDADTKEFLEKLPCKTEIRIEKPCQ